MTNRVLPIRLWPTGFLAFLGLGGLALLIALWPDWTLRYIHALAWPVVALIAVVTFGPALARRVPSLSALHLPGGFIATFEEQQESFELEGDYAAELTAADAWGAPLDEGDLALPEPPDAAPDPAVLAQEAVRILGTIVGSFQMQLDFLRTLATADDGLSQVAARGWFEDVISAKGLDPSLWEVDGLITWLVNQGAVALGQHGAYRATRYGQRVVHALALLGLFVAPKVV